MKNITLSDAVDVIDKHVSNPTKGLPEEVFLLISRLTALVNVDLLIKDEKGRILLSWRDDPYAGKGWHIPGGIIRFKEKLETRILKVAQKEIGASVKFDPVPIAVNEVICKHDNRGHAISFLYNCFLSGDYVPENKNLTKKDNGYLQWHDSCPSNLIKIHKKIYKKFM